MVSASPGPNKGPRSPVKWSGRASDILNAMSKRLILIPMAALALLLGLALAQDEKRAQPDPLELRVLILEKQLQQVQAYLQAQAQSAERFEQALVEVEKLGFTFGINPDSRKVFLVALRELMGALRKDVPGAPAKESTTEEKTSAQGTGKGS